MEKNKIVFIFDDEQDAREVINELKKKISVTWYNGTKEAMMKADTRKKTVLISKSIINTPKPLRF